MKRMLINATQPEEVRIALVDGQKLYDFDIENRSREQKKGNIYKARITRVEPSLEAAFVEFGTAKHGFLPLKEVAATYFQHRRDDGRLQIQDAVSEGQELIVQVDKEERGNKGAALTTFISLAGRYLVLMPNNPRAGGVSRRIEGEDRDQMREVLSHLELPQGMGLIVRTAGVGRGTEELNWDLQYLLQLWEAIGTANEKERAPKLLYAENNLIVRALRDNLRRDIGELLIDSQEAFEEARTFVDEVMPHYGNRTKYYDEAIPLFSRYQIESQIENAFKHTVKLPSGGSIVIDPTEALVSIDINSARATRGADIEETALNTNLEAAEEIARQLRLRDMGGLIVIDFIDMSSVKNQRAVENKMREALEQDRARIQLGRISRFGLLEMSRQRLRPSLSELTTEACPRCSGQGRVRDIKSLALAILRVMEEESLKERSTLVRALVPLNIAAYLLNEKRRDVAEIESRTKTHIVIVPNVNMETPQYEVQRIRDDRALDEVDVPSYELTEIGNQAPDLTLREGTAEPPREQAAVQPLPPSSPAPVGERKAQHRPSENGKPSLIKRVISSLFSEGDTEPNKDSGQRQRSAGSQTRSEQAPRETTGRARKRPPRRRRRGSDTAGEAANADHSVGRKDRHQDEKRAEAEHKGGKSGKNKRPRKQHADAEGKDGSQGKRKQSGDKPGRKSNGKNKRQASQQEQTASRAPEPETNREPPTDRKPSEETLARSKRRPRRDRGKIAEQGGREQHSASTGKVSSSNPENSAGAIGSSAPATVTSETAVNPPVASRAPAATATADSPPTPPSTARADTVSNSELESRDIGDRREDDAASAKPAESNTTPDNPIAAQPDNNTASDTASTSSASSPADDAPDASVTELRPAAAPRQQRAYNDPREVRRRQREAAQAGESTGA